MLCLESSDSFNENRNNLDIVLQDFFFKIKHSNKKNKKIL